MANVKFTSNKKNVLSQHERNIAKTLKSISIEADRMTKENIIKSKRVDTSTMLNSVQSETDVANREVVHGNTVSYAVFQELGTSRGITPGNFIRDTINNGQDQFKAIVEAVMSEGFN